MTEQNNGREGTTVPATGALNPAGSEAEMQTSSFTRGCFLLLAGGTLPVLFMNPLSYIFTLGVCYIITRGLARILF